MRWVEKLATFPLVSDPGTQFHYGFGLDVVGLLIELVSGKLLPDFLREEIFEPLRMEDTAFDVPEAKLPRLSACYELVQTATGNSFRLIEEPYASKWSVPRRHLTSAGGGLLSTARDYTRFMMMLAAKGTLDGRRAATPHSSASRDRSCSPRGRRLRTECWGGERRTVRSEVRVRGPPPSCSGRRVLGRKAVEYMLLNHLAPGVHVPSGFLHARGGVGFGIGGSVTVDAAANAVPGSVGQFSWGGAANCYMNIDMQEGLSLLTLIVTHRYSLLLIIILGRASPSSDGESPLLPFPAVAHRRASPSSS